LFRLVTIDNGTWDGRYRYRPVNIDPVEQLSDPAGGCDSSTGEPGARVRAGARRHHGGTSDGGGTGGPGGG